MTNSSLLRDGDSAPRHRGPTVPPGEITAAQAIRNAVSTHHISTYLLVLCMITLLLRFAYDGFVSGEWGSGTLASGAALVALALFLVDSAQLRSVRRHAWSRWGVRAWWLLPLLAALAALSYGPIR